MPWKGEKDPYKIWLSEIILQQTRVEQGLKYYEKFVLKYPTIQHLANSKEDDVLKDWEGLGYYSRCRNLHFTAKYVNKELNGVFPTKFEDILALKGVGMYTASAIASFAYNLPYAVVDGNVVRVLSRFTATKKEFVSNADKKYYQNLSDAFLSRKKAGEYNQAIMDFGATVCKPISPLCTECVIRSKCTAFNQNAQGDYPPKKKKNKLRKRYFHYIILQEKGSIYLRKRPSGDIWHGLYEPILLEQKKKPDFLNKAAFTQVQKLSHQELNIKFYVLRNAENRAVDIKNYQKVGLRSLNKKAFPKSVFDFF